MGDTPTFVLFMSSGGHFMKYWGGGECQGPRKIFMSVLLLGDPGACYHRKILKSTILEIPFLAFWGVEFYRIPKVVKYLEDMIFVQIIFEVKCSRLFSKCL